MTRHAFVRPGQVASDRVASDRCMACGQPEAAHYEWPRITVVHPEFGSYLIDVHCVRSPNGAMVLIAFQGVPSTDQVPLVRECAVRLGDKIEDLRESDISADMGIRLAAHFHANPDTKCGVIQVERPA